MQPPTDSGLLGDHYHISKQGSQEAKRRGESDSHFKLMMSAALVIIDATMGIEAWNRMHGGRQR